MKRELTMTARATSTVAPLFGVLAVLYATGAVGQASPVIAAAVAALATAVLVEPFRSTWTRAVFADQQRVQFCAQAMIALEAGGDLVQDIILTYHPN